MQEELLLSILIPTIPSRFDMARALIEKLEKQIGDLPIEILYLGDSKKRSIGMKRDALVQLAQGRMLVFCDDDDIPQPRYCSEIIKAIRKNPDVDCIVFNQQAILNGNSFCVRFGLEYENQQATMGEDGKFCDITRKPFHVCPWRRELAQRYRFDDINYGEDWNWIQQLLVDAKTQYRINDILHTYVFSDSVTEAK